MLSMIMVIMMMRRRSMMHTTNKKCDHIITYSFLMFSDQNLLQFLAN